jgi:hypothetical protein
METAFSMQHNVLNKDSALEFTQGIGFILCYGLFRSGIDKAMPFLIF